MNADRIGTFLFKGGRFDGYIRRLEALEAVVVRVEVVDEPGDVHHLPFFVGLVIDGLFPPGKRLYSAAQPGARPCCPSTLLSVV